MAALKLERVLSISENLLLLLLLVVVVLLLIKEQCWVPNPYGREYGQEMNDPELVQFLLKGVQSCLTS